VFFCVAGVLGVLVVRVLVAVERHRLRARVSTRIVILRIEKPILVFPILVRLAVAAIRTAGNVHVHVRLGDARREGERHKSSYRDLHRYYLFHVLYSRCDILAL